MRTARVYQVLVPERGDPLVRALFRLMNERRQRLEDVAARSGMSEVGIGHWRRFKSPMVVNYTAALGALGLVLVIFDPATGKIVGPTEEDGAWA